MNIDKKTLKSKIQNNTLNFIKRTKLNIVVKNNFDKIINNITKDIYIGIAKNSLKNELKIKKYIWLKSFLQILKRFDKLIKPIKKHQKGGNIIINTFIEDYKLNIIKKDRIENKKLLISYLLKGKNKTDKKDIEIIKLRNKLSEMNL